MNKLFLLFLLFYVSYSCSKDSSLIFENNEVELSFNDKLSLKKVNCNILGIADLFMIDSLLAFRIAPNFNTLHIYNPISMEKLGVIGETGKAGNEYLSLSSYGQLENSCDDIRFWTYDSQIKKMRLINLSKTLNNSTIVKDMELNYKEYYKEINYLCDNSIITQKINEDHMSLVKYDFSTNETIEYFNFFKDYKLKGDLFYFSSNAKINPKKTKLITAFKYINQIVISDLKNDSCKSFSVSIGRPILISDLSIALESQIVEYFSMVHVTDEQIWLLYQNQNMEQLYKNPKQSSFVVIDWNGDILHHIILDAYISNFTLDNMRGLIYAIDKNENVFKLNVADIIQGNKY